MKIGFKITANLLLSFLIFTGSVVHAQKKIELEQVWNSGDFRYNRVPGFNFLKDGRHYTRQVSNKIVKFDIVSGQKVDIILDGDEIRGTAGFNGEFSSYEFGPNEKLIILATQLENIYRRSSKAYYYIYDIEQNTLDPLFDQGKQMYPTLASNGNSIAFVFENNIYIKDLTSNETKQITSDGKQNEIINGASDWVYEEEFSLTRAFEWSPDNQKIAYIRFNETNVPEFTLNYYTDDLYPKPYTFKYPKVGEANAAVSVFIYDLVEGKGTQVQLPERELYIPRIEWTRDPNRLCVTTLNRHQNNMQLFLAKAKNGRTALMLEEKDPAYIELHDNLHFLKNGREFIWTSEKKGYNHIYLYSIKGRELAEITFGEYDVTEFYGVDEESGYVYYQAAKTSPLLRGVYRANLEGTYTETLQEENGTHMPQFSTTFDYYVDQYSTVNSPPSFTLYSNSNDTLRVLESNAELREIQHTYELSQVEFLQIPGDDGTLLNAFRIDPPNFDPSKEYPLFMFVYGGPGSQQVLDRWKGSYYWWFQMLAQQGYIVACVDNRGTGARGADFKKLTYLELGKYETLDQIAAARYFGNLPYINSERIGIFGWSYGGYMSSLAILKGADVFSLAVAVAPVTNWKWYDTIYTERYMRTESENPDGYRDNSPVYFAEKLEGDYLLVHGMGDDNVHAQHTLEMSRALVEAGKPFDLMIYPNDAHGIAGPGSRYHLFTKITNFIKENL
jgi:dipeptidyl-peptidase-4